MPKLYILFFAYAALMVVAASLLIFYELLNIYRNNVAKDKLLAFLNYEPGAPTAEKPETDPYSIYFPIRIYAQQPVARRELDEKMLLWKSKKSPKGINEWILNFLTNNQ